MYKLSKMTDYGVLIMGWLSQNKGRAASSSEISASTHIPEPTTSKILKALARAQLIQSYRGKQGGYRLDHPASEVNIAQIIDAIDGPIEVTACINNKSECCTLEQSCSVRGGWDRINNDIRALLENVTLLQMLEDTENKPYNTQEKA